MLPAMMAVHTAVDRLKAEFPFPDYLVDLGAHLHLAELVTRLQPDRLAGPVLDIGSGPCDKVAVLADLGYDCCACDDLQDPWHKVGDNASRIRAFAEAKGIRFQHADFAETTYSEQSFSIVMLNSVIEHLHSSPRPILNRAISLLRPGGHLIIQMPNSVNLRKRVSVLLGNTNYPPATDFFWSEGPWRGHVREWTPRETAWLLRSMGLRDVVVDTFHAMLNYRVKSPLGRAVYRIGTVPLSHSRDSISAWASKPSDWKPVAAASREVAVTPD